MLLIVILASCNKATRPPLPRGVPSTAGGSLSTLCHHHPVGASSIKLAQTHNTVCFVTIHCLSSTSLVAKDKPSLLHAGVCTYISVSVVPIQGGHTLTKTRQQR